MGNSTTSRYGKVSSRILESLVQEVMSESWGNLSMQFSEWQITELKNVRNTRLGVECLLDSWFSEPTDLSEETYCNATWDNVYCWPATPTGDTVTTSCQDAFRNTQPSFALSAYGNAYRVCLENATWRWGDWTNYTECARSYEEFVRNRTLEEELTARTQYILFIGSILSLVCLIPAVVIFQYFRCLRCDRVIILKNLKSALLLRYIFLLIITDPIVFSGSSNYRSVVKWGAFLDIVCKAVLTTYLYSVVASVNWMFVQGLYINGKLKPNAFDRAAPFKIYYFIGWGFPLAVITMYVVIMEINHPVKCWSGYTEMHAIWIVAIPIVFVLLVNALFLVNIVRILMTTRQNRATSSDAGHVRRAAISLIFLVPLLGVSNLLFAYNPGGSLHKYYITANALLGSTQGIFVAVGCCFLSKDVQTEIRRSCHRLRFRFNVRRNSSNGRTSRGRDRRLHQRVVGFGRLTHCNLNCLPDSPGVMLPQINVPCHLEHLGGHADIFQPLQINLIQDQNSTLTPRLHYKSTLNRQFNVLYRSENDDTEEHSGTYGLVEGAVDENSGIS